MSEITQTQKDKYRMYSPKVVFRQKAKKISLQFTIPENLDNSEDSKRDIH